MNLTIQPKWQPSSVCHVNGNKNDNLHSRSLLNGTTSRPPHLLHRILFNLFNLIFLFCSRSDSDSGVPPGLENYTFLPFLALTAGSSVFSSILISTCQGHSSKSKSPLALAVIRIVFFFSGRFQPPHLSLSSLRYFLHSWVIFTSSNSSSQGEMKCSSSFMWFTSCNNLMASLKQGRLILNDDHFLPRSCPSFVGPLQGLLLQTSSAYIAATSSQSFSTFKSLN